MRAASRTLALAVLAALAGCTLGPDYARPAVDAPAAFLYEPKDAAQAADTAWWKAFGDPVLDALIAEALAANRNVKIAAASVGSKRYAAGASTGGRT